MKYSVLILFISSIVFSACEEVPPFIDFSVPAKSKDTTYITNVIPAAQHKAVLIEDVTGVRCNNCPQAAAKAVEIINTKTADSVVVIALYSSDYNMTFTAPWPGFTNLNTSVSSQIISVLGSPNGLPSGYVDRTKYGSQTVRYNSFQNWSNYTNERLKISTPVNIGLQKSLNGRKLTVRMKLDYTATVSGNHKWAIYITESGIVSKQTTLTSYDDNYVHNHVLRASLGSAVGTALNASLIPGRVFEKEIEFEIPANFNIAKCNIVCVISDVATEDVVNVREVHIQ